MADRVLLYHLYPRKGEMWKWNLEGIAQYQDMFDAAVFHISYDVSTEHPTEAVREIARLFRCHTMFEASPNNPELGECIGFRPLVERAKSLNPKWVFYAHAKGVSHNENDCGVIKFWTDFMLYACLGDDKLIQEMMAEYLTIGTCKVLGDFRIVSPKHLWHYSGTFFWFEWDTLQAADLGSLLIKRHSVEELPGNLVPSDYAGTVLLKELSTPPCYFPDKWNDVLHEHRISDPYVCALWERHIIPSSGKLSRQSKRLRLLQSSNSGG